MNEAINTQAQKYQQLIAKCWSDEAFRQRLLAEPAAMLKQEGWELPDGLTVKLHEDTDQVVHLVLPKKRRALTDDELENVAGGIDMCDIWRSNAEPLSANGEKIVPEILITG